MRIDFVITELFVGGAERCLTELAVGLAKRGDHVRVFSLGGLPTGQQQTLVQRLRSSGIDVESAGLSSLRRCPAAYRQLLRWMTQTPPDVVQTFLYHANVLGTHAAHRCGVPVRVAGVRVAERNRWRCLIERHALRRCNSVVCVSQAVRRFAESELGVSAGHVIPNSVDADRFTEVRPYCWSKLGWPDDAVVSLFVGRFHPQKGIELMQQQIDRIAPPQSKARLLLVGEGPLRASLQHWADTIGHSRVQLLPWQEDVAPLMRACRLLLLPSRYEGMPNVVLEAMAAGRPVVCSRVEGSDELLGHASSPQLFPIADSAAMASRVEPLLSDPVLCDDLGRDNQAIVRDRFSIIKMIDAYRSHYLSLLSQPRDWERQH